MNDHWIPTSERLPELGIRVIVYNKQVGRVYQAKLKQYIGLDFKRACWWQVNGGSSVIMESITHWMPLPAPPE
jgi:hypothetical protein